MRVLALDLGLTVCGYVVCEVESSDITLLKEGQIKPDSAATLPQKLGDIYQELENEILKYCPKAVIVEKLYSHYKHPTTLGQLAQVRGAIAILAQQRKLEFFEYSPTRARKAFMGRGSVKSFQVKKMAENIMGRAFRSEHTADAFSLVVAFSHVQKFPKELVSYH